MNSIKVLSNSQQDNSTLFDSIRHLDENGKEFWYARELMPILGYKQWRQFEDAIDRAQAACKNAGNPVVEHFLRNDAKSTTRSGKDYRLSRYACYLTAMNGDSRKTEIAAAQSYFAAQARKAETAEAEARTIVADSFDSLTSGKLMGIRNALMNPGSVSPDEFAVLTEGISQTLVAKIGALTNDQYVKLFLKLRTARVPQDIQDQIEAGEFNDKELKIAEKTIERFDNLQKVADRKWQQSIGDGANQKVLKDNVIQMPLIDASEQSQAG
jgi:hypothetical protein